MKKCAISSFILVMLFFCFQSLSAVITADLSFEEEDLCFDASGFGNHGVLLNAETAACGKSGKGLRLTGAGIAVSLGESDFAIPQNNAFSLALWIRLDSLPGKRGGVLIRRGNFIYPFSLSLSQSGVLSFGVRTNRTFYIHSTSRIVPGVWTHVAAVYEEGRCALFINGAVEGMLSLSGRLRLDDSCRKEVLLLGAAPGGETPFPPSVVDEFKVFNHALSNQEVTALFRGFISPLLGPAPGTAGGQRVLDSSGNLYMFSHNGGIFRIPPGGGAELLVPLNAIPGAPSGLSGSPLLLDDDTLLFDSGSAGIQAFHPSSGSFSSFAPLADSPAGISNLLSDASGIVVAGRGGELFCPDGSRSSVPGVAPCSVLLDGFIYSAGASSVRRCRFDGSGQEIFGYGFRDGFGLAAGSDGSLFVGQGNCTPSRIFRIPPEGGEAVLFAVLPVAVSSLVNDGKGSLFASGYVAVSPCSGYDGGDDNIYRIDEVSGKVSLFSALSPTSLSSGSVVDFPDYALEQLVRIYANKPEEEGAIRSSDLLSVFFLDGSYAGIEDLSGLEALVNLEYLNLSGNSISRLSPLSGLNSLRFLFLGYNDVSDISALSSLARLKVLDLPYNRVSDVSPLGSLPLLEELSLQQNLIEDLTPLESLPSLVSLHGERNPLVRVSLQGMRRLSFLFLGFNSLKELSLRSLPNLRSVYAGYNSLSFVEFVELPLLSLLHLDHNQLSSGFSVPRSVSSLRLDYNRFGDIGFLMEAVSLQSLFLAGNPLNEVSLELYIPDLRAKGVFVSY